MRCIPAFLFAVTTLACLGCGADSLSGVDLGEGLSPEVVTTDATASLSSMSTFSLSNLRPSGTAYNGGSGSKTIFADEEIYRYGPVATASYYVQWIYKIDGNTKLVTQQALCLESTGQHLSFCTSPTPTYVITENLDGCSDALSAGYNPICYFPARSNPYNIEMEMNIYDIRGRLKASRNTSSMYLVTNDSPPQALSVSLSGPASATWKEKYTLTPIIQGGSSDPNVETTYQWYRLHGTGDWIPVHPDSQGNNSVYNDTMVYDDGFDYKVEVTQGNITVEDTHHVSYDDGSGGGGGCDPTMC